MNSHYFSSRSNAKNAFTLIELLVVITIIAILSAILFPVFANVREKARQTSCLSNMKQLGLGMAQYYQDFDETSPNGNYYFAAIGGWAGQLYPYVKNKDVFMCPDETRVLTGTNRPTSYGYNSNFGIRGNLSATPTPIPNESYQLSKLNAPALTVMLFEVEGNTGVDVTTLMEGTTTKNFNGSPFGNGGPGAFSPNGGGVINTCPATNTLKYATGWMGNRNPGVTNSCHYTDQTGRHSDGSNFMMADTHAKWLPGAKVSTGGNPVLATDAQQTFTGGKSAGTEYSKFNTLYAATFSIL